MPSGHICKMAVAKNWVIIYLCGKNSTTMSLNRRLKIPDTDDTFLLICAVCGTSILVKEKGFSLSCLRRGYPYPSQEVPIPGVVILPYPPLLGPPWTILTAVSGTHFS